MAGHILVIDDDADARTLLQGMLEHLGYTVATAGNGVEGLEEIAKQTPDLIVLDLMMPRMSGFEMMGKLRGSQSINPIPIVIMSSLATPSTQMDKLPGVVGALQKGSFKMNDLKALIAKLLGDGEAKDEPTTE
jgi:CheY-like chemotaxis protein